MQNMQKITTQGWPGTSDSLQFIFIKNDTEIRAICKNYFQNYPLFDFLRNIEQDFFFCSIAALMTMVTVLEMTTTCASHIHKTGQLVNQSKIKNQHQTTKTAPPQKTNKQSTNQFFLAHAVHARGSDGHQNVLSLISYSHVVREQVKSKKPGVFQSRNKTNPNTNTTQTTQQRRHPENKVKHYAFRKQNPHAAQYFFTMTQQFPQIDVPSDSKLEKVVVLHHPSYWTRVASWFTHVHVDELQGRSSTCKTGPIATSSRSHLSDRVKVPCPMLL